MDGNGELDLLVGSPDYDMHGQQNVGRAHLFYGPDFTSTRVFEDPTPQVDAGFGLTVLLTDLDGDDRDDVVIGAPLTNAQGFSNLGEVIVFHARDLDIPRAVPYPPLGENARFGSGLMAAPLSGGEQSELLVAAGFLVFCCPTTAGKVFVVDPTTLATRSEVTTPLGGSGADFGKVMLAEDLDGDGVLDLVVSAPQACIPVGGCFAGEVFVYPGPDYQAPSHTLFSPFPDSSTAFGDAVAITDLDKDGYPDILVGDWGQPYSHERVNIFYGPDYARVQLLGDEFDGLQAKFQGFGQQVVTGDFDGDTFQEVAVQAFLEMIWIWDQQRLQADTDAFSVAAGATLGFELDLGADFAGVRYLAALSATEPGNGLVLGHGVYLPLAIDRLTVTGLSLLSTPLLRNFVGTLDADGRAELAFHWPAGLGAAYAGQTLRVAAITFDEDQRLIAGTNAVEIVIGP